MDRTPYLLWCLHEALLELLMTILDSAKPISILIVEDDEGDQHVIKHMLRRSGLRCSFEVVSTLREAQLALGQSTFDCVLLDWHLPDGLGRDFLQNVPHTLPVVLLTGAEEDVFPGDAFSWGIHDYLSKNDLTPSLLARVLRYALIRQESRKLDERIVHSERLRLVGRVASGLAHEINNPLAWLVSNLSWLESQHSLARDASEDSVELDVEDASEALEMLRECVHAMARIQNTSRNLREFAQLSQTEGEVLGINSLVRKVVKLISFKSLVDIDLIDLRLSAGDHFFEANVGVMLQVITHVLVNASEAIERAAPSSFHRIVVSTWREGARVILEVKDTGDGIAPFSKDDVFQPFVTHDPQKSGMGLAFVARAVDVYGGDVNFIDGERGACIQLSFLAREQPREIIDTFEFEETQEDETSLRVLVVDSAPHMTKLFLLLAGPRCEFVRTTHLGESLEVLAQDDDFDGIFVNVPTREFQERGFDWYQQLAALAPDIAKRVVICATGNQSEHMDEFLVLSKAMLFEGPFDFTGIDPIIWHWKTGA